jgi:tripartite ATP-independent transporter DctP family solute receptor
MRIQPLRHILLWLSLLLLPGAAQSQTVIRFGYELPVTHEFHEGAKMLAKDVLEGTKGSVKIELYPAGQLTKDSTFPREITSGTVDAGLSPTLYWTGVMPIAGIFDVPYVVRDHDEAQKVLKTEVGQRLLDGLSKFNAVGLGYFNYGFGIFGTTKRPLLKPEDFKGMKVRTNNDIGAQLLKAFGASPTFMSGSEVYLGLQQGTVDGTHTGLSSVVSRKMWDVLKHLTVENHNMIPYFVVIRKSVYEKLTPDEQKVLRDAVAKSSDWVAKTMKASDDQAVDVLRKQGMQVEVLTPEQLKPWVAAAQPVVDQWLAKNGQEGEALLKSIRQTLGRPGN